MRPFIAVLALPLAGCISFSSQDLGKLPKEASGGMYTSIAPPVMADCIARAIGGTAQPQGSGFIVNSARNPALSYAVGPNPREGVYATQVAILGNPPRSSETEAAARCLAN